MDVIVGVHQDRKTGCRGYDLGQQSKMLFDTPRGQPGYVAAGPGKTRGKPGGNCIRRGRHNRYGAGCRPGSKCFGRGRRHNHIDAARHELSNKSCQLVRVVLPKPAIYNDVLTFDIAVLAQTVVKGVNKWLGERGRSRGHETDPWQLLRRLDGRL